MAICPIFLLNPNLSTICLATLDTCMKSFDAPVVTLSAPNMTSSAILNDQRETGNEELQIMYKEESIVALDISTIKVGGCFGN